MYRGDRKLQLIILLVLITLIGTMSIAYAVLSTTLNIEGTAQIQAASWNVHFDNVQVNPYSVEINPVITDNNKVTFSANLTNPGDFYKFTVDIVNEGSIDAMIESIIKTPELTTEQKKYLKYEVEYVDGTSVNDSQLLKSGETKTISILFSYRNDIPASDLPNTETDFDLEIVLVYIQADPTGVEISGNKSLVKVVGGDLNTVGSEICIDTECFYLINNDGYSVSMLAKYNLYAGNKCASSSSCAPYGEEATGLQDSTMIGRLQNELESNGTVNFSETNYWFDNNIDLNYPLYVYNSNSTLYNYVENYKSYLEKLGVKIAQARLIKVKELEKLGCLTLSYWCGNSNYKWVYSTSYWAADAESETKVYYVFRNGDFSGMPIGIINGLGIRPVIEIPLSEF